MAAPWALERTGGRAGTLSRLLPYALRAITERARTRRRAHRDLAGDPDDRRAALRHVVRFTGNSNQGLLDVRWGEASITDERPST